VRPFSKTVEIIEVNLYFSAALIAASQGEFAALSIGDFTILENSLKQYLFSAR
jgi:hypothetical protein